MEILNRRFQTHIPKHFLCFLNRHQLTDIQLMIKL